MLEIKWEHPNPLKPLIVGPFENWNISASISNTKRQTNQNVEEAISAVWERMVQISRDTGAILYDSEIYSLINYSYKDSILSLNLGITTFKELLGTNLNNPSFADKYGSKTMSNAIGLFGTVISSDNKLILGRRSSRYNSLAGKIHLPGGSMSCSEYSFVNSTNLFSAYHKELFEEIAVNENHIEKSLCFGLFENVIAHSPHLHFLTKLTIDSEKVVKSMKKARDGEFSDLILVDLSLDEALNMLNKYTAEMTFASKGALLYMPEYIRIYK